MEEYGTTFKDVRLDYTTWAILRAKSVELSLKSGKTITIRQLLTDIVNKEINKEEKI